MSHRGRTATGIRTATRVAAAFVTAAIDNFVATSTQTLFRLTTNTLVTVTQGSRQRGHDFARAAARILAELVAKFVGRFFANSFVAVIQTVDERGHDLWIADAVELVAQLVESFPAIFRIASGLRLVDQLRDLAGVIFAAGRAAAAIGIFATAGVGIVAASIATRSGAARTTSSGSTAGFRATRSGAVRSATIVATAFAARSGTVRSTVVRTGRSRSRTSRSARGGCRTSRSTSRRSGTRWSASRGSGARRSALVATSVRSRTARIAALLAAAGSIPATAIRFAAWWCQRRASTLIRVDRRATRPSDRWFAARGLAGRSATA